MIPKQCARYSAHWPSGLCPLTDFGRIFARHLRLVRPNDFMPRTPSLVRVRHTTPTLVVPLNMDSPFYRGVSFVRAFVALSPDERYALLVPPSPRSSDLAW